MTRQQTRIFTVFAAFLAGLVLSLGVILIAREHMTAPGAPQAAAIGGPFRLTDQDGRVVTQEDLKGRPSLVFFGFTHCPDVCPTTLFDISQIMAVLGPDADRTRAVFITVDPERDTPGVLKEYAQAFGANLAGWSFLTGPPATIRDVTRRYGIYASKSDNGDVKHTFLTSIIDPQGILRVQYLGARFDPEEFRRDLLSLLKE